MEAANPALTRRFALQQFRQTNVAFGMSDDAHQPCLAAEQYRARATLIRYTAEAVRSALLRCDLLEIANQYDKLAESTDAERRSTDHETYNDCKIPVLRPVLVTLGSLDEQN